MMKKILAIIILASLSIYSQTDVIVRGQLVTVKHIDDGMIIINDYIDSCRLETAQTVTIENGLNQMDTTEVPSLPPIGQTCEKNKLYGYNNQVILCLQTHQRTIYPPETTPALFAFYRSGNNLQWLENEMVAKDDIRTYQGVKYKCLMSHTCLSQWTPPQTFGVLWGIVPQGYEWTVGVSYAVGDSVTYLSNSYHVYRLTYLNRRGIQLQR